MVVLPAPNTRFARSTERYRAGFAESYVDIIASDIELAGFPSIPTIKGGITQCGLLGMFPNDLPRPQCDYPSVAGSG